MGEFQVLHQDNGDSSFQLMGVSLAGRQAWSWASCGNGLHYVQTGTPRSNPTNGSIQWGALEPTDAIEPSVEPVEKVDTYPFDPESGPPPPPWKAWSRAERDSLMDVTQTLHERQAHFDFSYLLDPIRSFISKARSGYLLVEGKSGAGKSYLGTYLEGMAPHLHPSGIRFAYLHTARRPYGDYETFIESINDQLAASNSPRTNRILPLDRIAMHDLAAQYPGRQSAPAGPGAESRHGSAQ